MSGTQLSKKVAWVEGTEKYEGELLHVTKSCSFDFCSLLWVFF